MSLSNLFKKIMKWYMWGHARTPIEGEGAVNTLTARLKKNRMQLVRGFTLIEFIVIVSIFAIIASIVLFNFSGFSNNIALTNMAHDVALVIRQAQVHGQSSVGSGQLASNVDAIPRGVYFEQAENDIIIFNDTDGGANYQFDPGGDQEIDTITMNTRGAYVSCISTSEGSCASNTPQSESNIAILFERPKLRPYTYGNDHENQYSGYAEIYITAPQNEDQIKIIKVWPTGQISVE